VSAPSPAAETIITREEKTTLVSLPKRATESMFPVRAIKVTAIIRIDHCSDSEVSKLSSSKNVFGETSKKIALSPNTVAPNFKIVRRRLIVKAEVKDIARA
jgi:hypothetical protein